MPQILSEAHNRVNVLSSEHLLGYDKDVLKTGHYSGSTSIKKAIA
jgi:hypothetical protein